MKINKRQELLNWLEAGITFSLTKNGRSVVCNVTYYKEDKWGKWHLKHYQYPASIMEKLVNEGKAKELKKGIYVIANATKKQ